MKVIKNVEMEKHVQAIRVILLAHDNLPYESTVEGIAEYINIQCGLAEIKGFVKGTVMSLDAVKISPHFFGHN